jgi:tetratricopeptide (TPR) repeat protein
MVIPLFKRSLAYHRKALSLYRSIKYLPGVAESLQFIGLYYQWAGDYHISIDYTNQSLEIFEKIGDIKGVEISTGNLAGDYLYLSDYKKALQCCNIYKTLAAKLDDTFGTAATLDTLAEIYKEKGDHAKAKQLQEESHDFAGDNNIGLIHCTTHISKGKLALEEGNIKDALESLSKAKDLYENGNYFDQYTAQVYALLAKVYCEKFKRERTSLSSIKKRRKLKKIKRPAKKH